MGKYHCTKNDVEDLLGDAVPEDANRNDVLDAVRTADRRVCEVLEEADTTAVDDDVLEGRLQRATTALAAHRLLMRHAENNVDVRLKKDSALDLLDRIRDGVYAADPEPVEEENNEPVEDEEGGE